MSVTDRFGPATEPRDFTKRPVTIQAMQWDGTAEGATPIINWILREGGTARYSSEHREGISPHRPDDINQIVIPAYLAIDTLEGTMRADPKNWIIRGVEGEFYACADSIFRKTYQ
jgi:hypothetical protein